MARSTWLCPLLIVACASTPALADPGRNPTATSRSTAGLYDPLTRQTLATRAPLAAEGSQSIATPSRKGVLRGEAPSGIRALIARHAKEQGVPVALADAVIRVESRYNPRARNGSYIGLSQISHRTARGIGYDGSPAGLFDPNTNLRFGMKYLGQAYRLAGGDMCGTVMRYQSGHAARRMNQANRIYCGKVRAIVASNDAAASDS